MSLEDEIYDNDVKIRIALNRIKALEEAVAKLVAIQEGQRQHDESMKLEPM